MYNGIRIGNTMIDLKKELNDKQYEAAASIDGPQLIIAGAGSGKPA